jgi:signal transduction histidine kinase
MHPHALTALGLGRALEQECRSFADRTGIGVATRIDDPAPPSRVALAAFRICQEALNNIARHARATSVRLELSRDAHHLCLSIKDNGIGLEPSRPRRGIGLVGMRERALSVGGRLRVESLHRRGVTIRLSLPLASGSRR